MKLNLRFPRNTISSIKTLHNIEEVAEEFERVYEVSKNDGQRLLIHELNLLFHESLSMEEFDSLIYFLDATINFWNDHTKIKMSVEKLVLTFKGFDFLITDLVCLFSVSHKLKINGGIFSRCCLEKYMFFFIDNEYCHFNFLILDKEFSVNSEFLVGNVVFMDEKSKDLYYPNDFFERYGFLFI